MLEDLGAGDAAMLVKNVPAETFLHATSLTPESDPKAPASHRRGVPIPVAKKLIDHADVQTTMRYLSVRDEDVVAAIDLL